MSDFNFPADAIDLIVSCNRFAVAYLIVGGFATIHYGYIRVTGDVDFFYSCDEENCKRLYKALTEFWGTNPPMLSSYKNLMNKDQILQYGVPPNRLDIISEIEGVTFAECWENRKEETLSVDYKGESLKIKIPFIGFNELVKNKKSTGRQKDKNDVHYLTKNRK